MLPNLVVAIFLLCASSATGCSITGYVDMKMMERLVQSTYVVYGTTTWHTPTRTDINGKSQYVIDATYEVHCILKEGEDPMMEQITISQISPEQDCAGTDVVNNLKVGDYSIIALKNTTDGKYVIEEVMPEMTGTFYPMKPYFFTLANLCGMQAWKSPVGSSTNKCPICGVSDFAPEVTTLDNSGGGVTNCEFYIDGIVSNMTACDLYIKGTVDYANSQTCIPASYNDTCVNLLYRTASATCDCNRDTSNNNFGTADGHVILPNKIMAALAFLIISFILNY